MCQSSLSRRAQTVLTETGRRRVAQETQTVSIIIDPPTERSLMLWEQRKWSKHSTGHPDFSGVGGIVMLKRARTFMFALGAVFMLVPVSAFSQSFQIGPGGVRIDDGQGRGGGQCEELRLACENKDSLGEQGGGNCRRYRETCQRRSRRDICGELRQACLNKDQLGEQGAGNCRRYRQTCRGRI